MHYGSRLLAAGSPNASLHLIDRVPSGRGCHAQARRSRAPACGCHALAQREHMSFPLKDMAALRLAMPPSIPRVMEHWRLTQHVMSVSESPLVNKRLALDQGRFCLGGDQTLWTGIFGAVAFRMLGIRERLVHAHSARLGDSDCLRQHAPKASEEHNAQYAQKNSHACRDKQQALHPDAWHDVATSSRINPG